MLDSNAIQKYSQKSIPWLLDKATFYFNKFIRERDKDKGCISCGGRVEDACHYYSAGHYSYLRFNEDNVHGGCTHCNKFLHGNLIEYRKGLVKKIGEERIKKLDETCRISRKWEKIILIEIILSYKNKC